MKTQKMQKITGENGVAFNELSSLLKACNAGKKDTKYTTAKDVFIKELEKYIEFLHEFEVRITHKDINVKVLQEELNRISDRMLDKAEDLENEITSPSIRKDFRSKFRKVVGKWVYESKLFKRALEKPLGYAGDYAMIEMFYNYKPLSTGLGYYFDGFFLSNTLASADITRKDGMKELIKDYLENSSDAKLKILNYGCGSCREMKELFSDYSPKQTIEYTCVDQDAAAIEFSKNALKKIPTNITIDFIQANIVDLLKRYRNADDLEAPLSGKNLVYSMGLVDYFTDNVLKLFVEFCLKGLIPGGKLIIAHKNRRKARSFLSPKWLCDWMFYTRDKTEVLKLIKDEISGYDLEITWEKTRHMFYLIITKSK